MVAFFESKEFWAAIVGGAFTLTAVWVAVVLGLRRLRDTELSRLRIKCVTELISYRFFMTGTNVLGSESYVPFLSALNAIPGLFGDNERAMRLLRDYREQTVDRKNQALFDLIRLTAHISRIPLTAVSNIDLETPFTRN